MNAYARFDEIPFITLKDIKKTKRYGRTDAKTDNVKTVYPPTKTVCGGIKIRFSHDAAPTHQVFPVAVLVPRLVP